MALRKSFELSNGTSGDYNRISLVHCDNTNKKLFVNVELYKDSDTRTLEKDPMKKTSYCLDYPDLKSEEVNVIQKAYSLLKLHSDFSGAEDC